MGLLIRFDPSSFSVRLQETNNRVKTQAIGRWLGAALLCLLAMLAMLAVGVRPAAAQSAHYVGVVSSVGSGFSIPYGVAVDASGDVFVADFNHGLVKEILAGTGGAAAGTVNASSTVIPVGSGFITPEGVAVDAHGNVFVADPGNNSVQEIVADTNGAVNAS